MTTKSQENKIQKTTMKQLEPIEEIKAPEIQLEPEPLPEEPKKVMTKQARMIMQSVSPEEQAILQRRAPPQNELDLVLMTTESVWGKQEVSSEIKERLNKFFLTQDEEGNEGYTIGNLWGLLGYYTRDMRLANLNPLTGEVKYCQYYLDLAGDFLQAGMIEPFIICLSRVATELELSQSKGGFLRRKMSTFTHEQIHQEIEPPKRKLFGGKQEAP